MELNIKIYFLRNKNNLFFHMGAKMKKYSHFFHSFLFFLEDSESLIYDEYKILKKKNMPSDRQKMVSFVVLWPFRVEKKFEKRIKTVKFYRRICFLPLRAHIFTQKLQNYKTNIFAVGSYLLSFSFC